MTCFVIAPGVRFVGDTTRGGLVSPLIRELPNGWTYRLPHLLEYDVSRRTYEGVGMSPDVVVRDAQLERAIALGASGKWLRREASEPPPRILDT